MHTATYHASSPTRKEPTYIGRATAYSNAGFDKRLSTYVHPSAQSVHPSAQRPMPISEDHDMGHYDDQGKYIIDVNSDEEGPSPAYAEGNRSQAKKVSHRDDDYGEESKDNIRNEGYFE